MAFLHLRTCIPDQTEGCKVRAHSSQILSKSQSGVTAIEYALIAALIAVAAISAFSLVGTNLSSTFSYVASQL
jgi:pilus assembly protein Flp/PilA